MDDVSISASGTALFLHVYLTCDEGLDIRVKAGPFFSTLAVPVKPVDVEFFTKDFKHIGTNWRVMTNEEINEYEREEAEGD